MYNKAASVNRENIGSLVEEFGARGGSLLDIGCDDGSFSISIGARISSQYVCGLEVVKEQADKAAKLGVDARVGDVTQGMPFGDDEFDVVHANQVIEHVSNVDIFMREAYRVTKPGGVCIVSTENGSSWCNIGAAVMGWQQFSLTNVSAVRNGVGNPLALHRMTGGEASSWTHKTIFNYRGLLEFGSVHGFNVAKARGAGYFPLPASTANFDVRHSHFITVAFIKPS